METILDIQQRVRGWLVSFEAYLLPFVKFLLMMAVLLTMNWHLGYRLDLMRWILVILASLVCALLPFSGMTAVAAVYLLGHISALSWEAAAVLGGLMFIAVLLHYLFLPGGSFLIVLVPLAFYLRIPYLVPLLAGLMGNGLSFLPVGIGVVLYYTMLGLERNALTLLDMTRSIPDQFMLSLGILSGNRMMVVMVVAFCLTTLAVYALNRLPLDYMEYISVGVGVLLLLLIVLVGGQITAVPVGYPALIAGCVISAVISLIAAFWLGSFDYSRPEFLKYEDDEYRYYVKAVPRMVVPKSERKVTEISSHRDANVKTPVDPEPPRPAPKRSALVEDLDDDAPV